MVGAEAKAVPAEHLLASFTGHVRAAFVLDNLLPTFWACLCVPDPSPHVLVLPIGKSDANREAIEDGASVKRVHPCFPTLLAFQVLFAPLERDDASILASWLWAVSYILSMG